MEHLNARLQPTGKLDKDRELMVNSWLDKPRIAGGHVYQIWIDVNLESRTENPIELTNFSIDNFYKGQRVGSGRGGDYRIWLASPVRRLRVLGKGLGPNQSRLIRDFPIPTDSHWKGTEFVVHYLYKIPTLSNEEFDTPVRIKKI